MTTTPTQPTGHEALTSTLYIHRLFEGDDADGPSVCGCGLVEPDEVFYADSTNDVDAERQWHAEHLTTEVIAALANTGVLATEQEWGVRHSQGIRREPSQRSASEWSEQTNARNADRFDYERRLKTTVVSRRVTAWTEENA